MSVVPDLPMTHHATTTPAGTLLRTLVLCDLADSTALVERLGDQRAAELFRKHDRLARDLLHRHLAREIDKTDGFLVLFDRPIQAVAFALAYQRELRALGQAEGVPLCARLGIHVGDVVVWDNSADDVAHGAKPVEVEGLAKPVAARLVNLARPGQVLLSASAYEMAYRARDELVGVTASWRHHGQFCAKGVATPIDVYEIGEVGVASFTRPASNDKIWRHVPRWRRPLVLVAELVALVAIVIAATYFFRHSEPALAFAERDWVVVGDLRNLTKEPLFDDSLATAFRISLEQSRFVNVVSDLQVRDTLKRMAKSVDTEIDRAIGAEIAIREGARALILPTVAEVGGRVRFSAEVIDPHTQATVFAESADGRGAETTLPSIDTVTRELRGKLGEALASIERDTRPLPKVLTASLDALRAYALGVQANSSGRRADALQLYQQALSIDPEFALAEAAIAGIYMGSDDLMAALDPLRRALALRDRLTVRESMYVEALYATFGPPKPMLERWKAMASLYPDAEAAHANYALFVSGYVNDIQAAIQAAEQAISPHSPRLGNAHYLLGRLYLAADRLPDADIHLAKAKALSGDGLGMVRVSAAAARRDFQSAHSIISETRLSGIPSNDALRYIEEVSVLLDQGKFQDGLALARRAQAETRPISAHLGRLYSGVELTMLSTSQAKQAWIPLLKDYLEAERVVADSTDDPNRHHAMFSLLFGALMAARNGEPELAHSALSAAMGKTVNYPVNHQMLVLAQAELARATGEFEKAIAALRGLLDGTELYQVHATLQSVLFDAGRHSEAIAESKWLQGHRGRAYAETNSMQLLQPMNVLESNLAYLSESESWLALGEKAKSRAALDSFRAVWPGAPEVDLLAGRLTQLSYALAR